MPASTKGNRRMNEININPSRIEKAPCISCATASQQLRRIAKITFAITSSKDENTSFAFASQALADYLHTHQPEITEARLVYESGHPLDAADNKRILHLDLKSGERLHLNEHDQLRVSQRYQTKQRHIGIYSPYKLWQLPKQVYLCQMLVTERMFHFLEDLGDDGQHAYLLNILWKEYQLHLEQHGASADRQKIQGEFMSFSAKTFSKGFVLFDFA
jgi:hypothetical protein